MNLFTPLMLPDCPTINNRNAKAATRQYHKWVA
ncbi:hypothetical protein M2401_005232 [Pseudomonas sp. JUb42]|jgi:hypothetical protein|nr:hypothetical protein [Pseudomonas sp. JUb42]